MTNINIDMKGDKLYKHYQDTGRAKDLALKILIKSIGTDMQSQVEEQYDISCKNHEESFNMLIKYVLKLDRNIDMTARKVRNLEMNTDLRKELDRLKYGDGIEYRDYIIIHNGDYYEFQIFEKGCRSVTFPRLKLISGKYRYFSADEVVEFITNRYL